MKLIIDTTGPTDQLTLDIDTMLESCDDADALFAFVLGRICRYVHTNGQSLDDFYVVQLDGDVETGLDVPDDSASDFTHLREACQLFWYMHEKDRWVDESRIFARINDHWKYTNFDDLKSEIEDDYSAGFDKGDEDDWAKEWVEETEGVPESLMSYIDWDKYAADLLQDYEQYEWDGKIYLYYS